MDAGEFDRPLTGQEIKRRVEIVLDVMKHSMKEGVHFGTIPGTPKPGLWKAGAEKLAMSFGLSIDTSEVELDERDGEVTYTVTAKAFSSDGQARGSHRGVCSSLEEKYRWRRAKHRREWDNTDTERRRTKWGSDESKDELQVRTEPNDVRNTILQMADKRATVALIRKVTAASDIFADPEAPAADAEPTEDKRPQRASAQRAASGPGVLVTEARVLKSGKSGKGPWTLHKIEAGGQAFVTFDTKHYALAVDAKANGERVIVTGKKNEKGDFDLETIELAPEAPAIEPAATAIETTAAASAPTDSGPDVLVIEGLAQDKAGKVFTVRAGGLTFWTEERPIYAAAQALMAQSKKARIVAGEANPAGEFQIVEISAA